MPKPNTPKPKVRTKGTTQQTTRAGQTPKVKMRRTPTHKIAGDRAK